MALEKARLKSLYDEQQLGLTNEAIKAKTEEIKKSTKKVETKQIKKNGK